LKKLHDTIVIARSNKPALELRKFGIATKFVPKMNTIGGIIDLIGKLDVKIRMLEYFGMANMWMYLRKGSSP
jgi:hypothetical protein